MRLPQIEFLNDILDRQNLVEESTIRQAISDIVKVPILQAILKPHDFFIDRISMNEGNLKEWRARYIQRLSYLKDKKILKNRTAYGRANLPKKSMFYGALLTKEIISPRLTAFLETSEMAFDISIREQYFTVSIWRIKSPFLVYECVFQDDEIDVNENTIYSRERQNENLKSLQLSKEEQLNTIEVLKFFSKAFSKKVLKTEDYNYKITALFTDMILSHPKNQETLWGITYPSVKSGLLGQNIAISPEAVDSFLEFESAFVMKAERTNTNDNLRLLDSFDRVHSWDENGKLTWKSEVD